MKRYTTSAGLPIFLLLFLAGCSDNHRVSALIERVIDPPGDCDAPNETRDCALARDYPDQDDLSAANSENVIYQAASMGLEVDGVLQGLDDTDGDGVETDLADECNSPPPADAEWLGGELCDGDASNDGVFAKLVYGGDSVTKTVTGAAQIRKADVYFLANPNWTMTEEGNRLKQDIINGSFATDPDCPTKDEGLVGAIKCEFEDTQFGAGAYYDYPFDGYYGREMGQVPYHHMLDITDDVFVMNDAVQSYAATGSGNVHQAGSQAMYSVLTGRGLGDMVPNRTGCPDGTWGYPCFRDDAFPIIVHFTDSGLFNGPASTRTYPSSFSDLDVVQPSKIPPATTHPVLLNSNDSYTAYDVGDMSNRSITLLGHTRPSFMGGATPDFTTGYDECEWTEERLVCFLIFCEWREFGPKPRSDSWDNLIRFSLSQPATDFEYSGGGSLWTRGFLGNADAIKFGPFDITLNYPTNNILTIYDPTAATEEDASLSCSRVWNDTTISSLPASNEYFAIQDLSWKAAPYWTGVIRNNPLPQVNNQQWGPHQIRLKNSPEEDIWETTAAPVTWAQTKVAFDAAPRPVKVLTILSPIISPSSPLCNLLPNFLIQPGGGDPADQPCKTELALASGYNVVLDDEGYSDDARADMEALATETDSLDENMDPYIEEVAADGAGVSEAVIDMIARLADITQQDITIEPVDNTSTAFDETKFVKEIRLVDCPTTGDQSCAGVSPGTEMTPCVNCTCSACERGAVLTYEIDFENSVIDGFNALQQNRVFDFYVALKAGDIEIDRIPVRVLVPATTGVFEAAGRYWNVYDSTERCETDPVTQRPTWDDFTWDIDVPAGTDAYIDLSFTLADSLAELELDSTPKLTIRAEEGEMGGSFNIEDELKAASDMLALRKNFLYMKVEALLEPSSDTRDTPVLRGWELQFRCGDAE